MAELSGLGLTLLSDAFDFDFDPALVSVKQRKSKAADRVPAPHKLEARS